jgi:hypothetical protein
VKGKSGKEELTFANTRKEKRLTLLVGLGMRSLVISVEGVKLCSSSRPKWK